MTKVRMRDNLSFCVSEETRKKIELMAERGHCSMSDIARVVLYARLQAMEAESKV